MTTGLLRAAAVAIAVAALIDPPVTMTARGRARLALVLQNTGLASAREVHATLSETLRTEFEVIQGFDAAADAAVIVGTAIPDSWPEGLRTFTVTVPPAAGGANSMIIALRTPRDAAQGALVHLEIAVEGRNLGGSTSTLRIRAGKELVEVARATHMWSSAFEVWRAAFDVTPPGQPPWRLRAEVSGVNEGDRTDNVADAIVPRSEPMRVLVYEPRLSWPGTFVRRALERDPRFDVAAQSYPSRSVQVATAGADLQRILTDGTRVVVAGGLDRTTDRDAGLLSRFMRERGGAVVLVPDSRTDAGAIARLLPVPSASEVLLEQPAPLSVEAPLARIEASELLTFEAAPASRALAWRAPGAPVIEALPVGAGQLIVSGALDAWRFRANDSGAFDRFWHALVAGFAAAAPRPIDVEVVPAVVGPGKPATVRVHVRRAALDVPNAADVRVSASLSPGDPVRLWPGDRPDSFYGVFTAPTAPGAHRVTVTVANAPSEPAQFVVADGARTAAPTGLPLTLLAESRGGRNFDAAEVSSVARTLRQEIAAPTVRAERRPMRSPWWLVPFVACLGGEWWLRRRRGLR